MNDYNDIKELVNSPISNKMKDEFNTAKELYKSKSQITNNTMETAAKSICKFYNGKKTAVFAKTKSESNYSSDYEYKINRNNIGQTRSWGKNIIAFGDIQEFFNLLKFQYFQKGLKRVMKKEGKQIVDFLISLNEKYDLPKTDTYGDKNKLGIHFNPTPEERDAFELNKTAYICIDEDGIYIDNNKSGNSYSGTNLMEDDNNEDNQEKIITLRAIESSDGGGHILRTIFLVKHEQELNKLIEDYKIKLNKDFTNWENFKEEFNQRLAKYVLLDALCGKK